MSINPASQIITRTSTEHRGQLPVLKETRETGIFKTNSRIFFGRSAFKAGQREEEINRVAISSISRQVTPTGIKKAGLFERLFGKATKLTFRTRQFNGTYTDKSVYVNTKSLKKYIFDISQHQHFFSTFSHTARIPGQPGRSQAMPISAPHYGKDLEKAHDASFKVFKQLFQLEARRGADTIDGADRLSASTRLACAVQEYAKAVDFFDAVKVDDIAKAQAMQKIHVPGRARQVRIQDPPKHSAHEYQKESYWRRIHKQVYYSYEIHEGEQRRAAERLRQRPVRQITAVERSDESSSLLPSAKKVVEYGAVAAISGTLLAGGAPLVAASGLALYGVGKTFQYFTST